MAQTLSVDQLATAVNSILAEYKGLVDADLEKVTKSVGRKTAQTVRANISAQGIKGTGAYKKSISVRNTKDESRHLRNAVVYARAPHYRLTHLLEYGHAVVVAGGRTPGPGKKTRVDARPHWAEAERQAIAEFESRLKEAIERK